MIICRQSPIPLDRAYRPCRRTVAPTFGRGTRIAMMSSSPTVLAVRHSSAFVFVSLLVILASTAYAADPTPELKAQWTRMFGAVQPKNLADTVHDLAGFGSRVTGYDGD